MKEFAGALAERICIERSVPRRNQAGLVEPEWQQVARCRAMVVPEGTGPESEGMALSAMPRFRVTIRRNDEVAIDQRVRWAGCFLTIRQVLFDPRSKDRLTLRCEEVRS